MAKRGAPPLSTEIIEQIQSRWIAGEACKDIARNLGVSTWSVTKYIKGLKRELMPEALEGESWKPISGYEGRYFISNLGRLYSNGNHGGRHGIIKTVDNGNGYRVAILSWNGKTVPVLIHRLVAKAYCEGETDERSHVNHIDGNRSNNRAENLEWVTRSENMLHSTRVLGHKTPSGVKSSTRKLSAEQVRAIREDVRTNCEIAADYGVGHSTISNVKLGRYYKDVI